MGVRAYSVQQAAVPQHKGQHRRQQEQAAMPVTKPARQCPMWRNIEIEDNEGQQGEEQADAAWEQDAALAEDSEEAVELCRKVIHLLRRGD
eukprot:CAMPEP_0177686766 /NCGR_PEP_ID=MMETSP0447-20121125/33755_1 /TAXON_ID=0 /ORGANISM="Stygamoeba regulata, Strain BSH-02190019" /LENGTH=90 /DNA_ID=CAMNT_0019196933 /DNA_START=41 /DNA_END=311 /DNA_ORIENTATION=-